MEQMLIVDNTTTETFIGVLIMPAGNETVRRALENNTTFNPSAENPVIDLVISMPCEESVTYKTLDDIPEVDTPCPCGNPNHWFIKVNRTA